MFGMGMPEILLILAIALIVIGPKKLPDLAKSIGRAMGEFKRASQELKDSFDIDPGLKDVKNVFSDTGTGGQRKPTGDGTSGSTDTEEDPALKEAKTRVDKAFEIEDVEVAGDWQRPAESEDGNSEDASSESRKKTDPEAEGGNDDQRG